LIGRCENIAFFVSFLCFRAETCLIKSLIFIKIKARYNPDKWYCFEFGGKVYLIQYLPRLSDKNGHFDTRCDEIFWFCAKSFKTGFSELNVSGTVWQLSHFWHRAWHKPESEMPLKRNRAKPLVWRRFRHSALGGAPVGQDLRSNVEVRKPQLCWAGHAVSGSFPYALPTVTWGLQEMS